MLHIRPKDLSQHPVRKQKSFKHFILFQLNTHSMLNTFVYHELPPACFGVCYTVFRETIVLLAHKLCAFCNVAL